MPSQREDYILRLIEMVGEMLRQVVRLREDGRIQEALWMLIAAQEKLFGRPAEEFVSLPIDEQLRRLTINESAENSRAKRLAYASALREAGLAYQARGEGALAESAFQLALYVTLTVAIEPDAADDHLRVQMAELMTRLAPDRLYPSTLELLARINSA